MKFYTVPISEVLQQLTAKLEKDARTSREYTDHCFGMHAGEPLIFAMDALYKFAAAYFKETGGDRRLADDGYEARGRYWLDAAKGIRAMLNFNGACAMERRLSSDSKSNSAVESLFWAALEVAGYKEEDL